MELTTIGAFRAAIADGLIVITDDANGNKVHRRDCPDVTERNFLTKVVEGGRKNGGYFLVLTEDEAARKYGAALCGRCYS